MTMTTSSEHPKTLTLMQSAGIGFLAGPPEVFVHMPLMTIKQDLQKGLPIVYSPKVLWGGFLVYATGMATVTSMQVMGTAAFKGLFSQDGQPLTDRQKLLAAALGGAFGALVASPSELVMDHQAENMKIYREEIAAKKEGCVRPPYSYTIKKLHTSHGSRVFLRGLGSVAIRDAGFTAGYGAGVEIVDERLKPYVANDWVRKILAGMVTGLTVAVATHIFDTKKVRAHALLPTRLWNGNVKESLQVAYKGISFRAFRTMSAVPLLDYLTRSLSKMTLGED